MHRWFLRASVLVGVLGATAGAARCRAQSSPVERAEFQAAVRAAKPRAQRIAGSLEAFRLMVQPFGPLDLIVLGASTGRQASLLRSSFLGFMGSSARVDPGPLANAWHCGEPCGTARRDTLVQRLTAIRSLVERFDAMKGLDVLAPWPRNGYRADVLTFDGQDWSLDTASPELGLIPWQRTIVADSGRTHLAAMGVDRTTVGSVIAGMRREYLGALARDPSGGIRAVLHGAIGDNEAGLLFLPADATPPSFYGTELLDGRRYVLGELIAPGVYFYETT